MASPTIVDAKVGQSGRPPPADGSTRYHLLILARDGAIPRLLPQAGTVAIGRDDEVEIRLNDPRASRRHARLTVASAVEIEDLGSANGTAIRNQRLAPGERRRLEHGDVVAIGNTLMVLQQGEPDPDPRRIWAHGYLETRLIEECARAQAGHGKIALARLHLTASAPAILVEEIITDRLHRGELLAAYAPGEYEILALDVAEGAARTLIDGVVAALAAKNIGATVGLAFYPADGTSPQALIGRAAERVRSGAARVDEGVVVESPAMHALYELARRAAIGNSNVLILGETGAGKEVLAETIHRASPRAQRPLLALNCAALSESVVESELFGHERGAFTGAAQAKPGLLEAAAGGTVFLDEIGEMPLSIQAKLLRVLETRQVLRVGATQPRPIDVRFLAATNRDLEDEVAEKRFREDLYFRLNVITLEIPPLRDRPAEIASLARLFLARLAATVGRPPPAVRDDTLELMRAYAWPGNIRELRNVIERAFVLCDGLELTPEHLPTDKMRRRAVPQLPSTSPASPAPGSEPAATEARGMRDIERQAIVDALQRCHFNQTRAAELLGMPRRTFCKRLKEYAIPRPRD
ncbi:MAG TPA: sigma 54-interacting transcriptional regulator [Polyangia bacterium]|nr:sigma 54-interacting transcriptional regulator [Polyangia bacterium]